jgi:serine kinase of HPr protein (carbohydrate metabolism regulator)
MALIEAGAAGRLPFARLVTDDRALVEAAHGRLLVRPPPSIAGLIEVRGIGVRRLPYEPVAVAGWIVDLDADAPERLPGKDQSATINGIELPLIAIPRGTAPLPMLLAAIRPVE